jgi:BirA family biotin operon repressor/biotin-[acetyl-CoA-carboxylase] ligase
MPFDLQRVREQLPGRRVEWFDSIDSTMNAAARLAREGCAPGTVIGAEEQTAGIGRHGHSWHSEAGAGLYVSLVLGLPLSADALPLVMLALGLATQETIAQATGLAADLRWPNDVLFGGRKCAGILAQLEGGVVIAGIGINVSHARFPPEIEDLATSLRLEGAAAVSREDLLVALIRGVDDGDVGQILGPVGPLTPGIPICRRKLSPTVSTRERRRAPADDLISALLH